MLWSSLRFKSKHKYNNNNINNDDDDNNNNLYYAFVDVHSLYYNLVDLLTIENFLIIIELMCKLGS